jgi:hypothetical protein
MDETDSPVAEKQPETDAISGLRERKIIWLFCLLAAVHVFIFSAAFPPINNVDESQHFDLVVKYSHGHLPQSLEPTSNEAMDYIAIYASQEFFWSPEVFPGGKIPPPLWALPPETMTPLLKTREAAWQHANHESSQPPLYYALAGFWWKAGQWLGFSHGRLFYWVRFLNILFVAALIWLGYFASRMVFPENIFLRLGVPAFLAFMPQSAFYSIGNDVLSPLVFGAVFVLLIYFFRADIPNIRVGAAVGLALGTTFLTKMTNLPLLSVSAIFIALKIFRISKERKLRATLPALTALFFATLPAACWMVWCKINFGDFTGSKLRMEHFGWTIKPVHDWWQHPIFTPLGLWTYLAGQLATFWQGEFWWHGAPLAWSATDALYTLASLFLLVLAVAGLFQPSAGLTPAQRGALWFALAAFTIELSFFALMSVIFDFHDCPNPSREHPYFHAGRMMLGALIPFLLLFVYGIDRAMNRFGNRGKFLALAVIILFMLVSEITTDWPAFSSQYNWFHM